MAEPRGCCTDVANKRIKEAVCIDTERVYDSCADKDCFADLRVCFTNPAQDVVDRASTVRCRGCEILNVFVDVEKVPFNKGFYSVDVTYFVKVMLDAFTTSSCPPIPIEGLTTFSKKCILYGSEGKVKVFSSEYSANEADEQYPQSNTNPKAKVQTVDPICLDAKLCKPCDCCSLADDECACVPRCIRRCFDGEFGCQSRERAVAVTLGVFTIIQMERDVQMLIPAYDFCIPTKECCCETEDPCDAFRKIQFPVNEFFPPDRCDLKSDNLPACGCGR
ncbi:MAG: hypothetical protein GX851_04455 [Clostridiales bacterium]|jgi:hypothetical protein|nr:hypothetical protein [Clostridiales bacterium]